jgi:hypothetical protein
MREFQVDSTSVNIETFTQNRGCHDGALNMPARATLRDTTELLPLLSQSFAFIAFLEHSPKGTKTKFTPLYMCTTNYQNDQQ